MQKILLLIIATIFLSTPIGFTQSSPNLVIQESHPYEVFRLAQHPSKEVTATANQSEVKIWDSRSWILLHTINFLDIIGSDATILNLEFTQDNKLIVTTVELLDDLQNFSLINKHFGKRTSFLIDITTGELKKSNHLATLMVEKPTMERLFIEQQLNEISFQIENQQSIKQTHLDNSKITFATYSPDRQTLVCGYANGRIEFRNATSFQLMKSIETEIDEVLDVHFVKDSLLIIEGGNWNEFLPVIDLNKMQLIQEILLPDSPLDLQNYKHALYFGQALVREKIHHLGIDYDNTSGWLAIGVQMNRVHFRNLYTGEERFINTPFAFLSDLLLTSNGQQLILTGEAKKSQNFNAYPIITYNFSTGQFLQKPNYPFDNADEIGWTKDGEAFYALSLGSFTKWSLKSLGKEKKHLVKEIGRLGPTNFIKGINNTYVEKPPFVRLGYHVYDIDTDSTFEDSLWPTMLQYKEEDSEVAAFIPMHFALVYSYKEENYTIYNQKDGKPLKTIDLKDEKNFQISNDGNWFAYFNESNSTLKILSTNTWKETFSFGIDLDAGEYFTLKNNFDFSRNSQQFVFFQDRINPPELGEISPPSLHHVQVYQLENNNKFKLRKQFKYDAPINVIHFGYDQNTILTGTEEAPNTIELWDIKKGIQLQQYQGHGFKCTKG